MASIYDRAGGLLELLAQGATGGAAQLGGGLTYAATAPFVGNDAAQAMKRSVEGAYTYQPRTETAQGILGAIGRTIAPAVNYAGGNIERSAQQAGEYAGPAGYAAVKTLPTVLQALVDRPRVSGVVSRTAMQNMADADSLRKEIRSLIGDPKSDDDWRDAFFRLTPEQRDRLNYIEGVALPSAERSARSATKRTSPSQDALNAAYMSPDEVPPEVMAYVRKGSPITQDASDAVRWARIVGTQSDPRLGGGVTAIYRAVDGDEIRPGDWVTTSEQYALDHLRKNLKGKGRVIKMNVSGEDVLLGPTGDYEEAFYAPMRLSGPYSPSK